MLSKKKKIFILVGMVALLVVTGCLNIFLNNKSTKASASDDVTSYGNFFMTYRTDRQATRDQTIMYLDAIIQNEASTEDAVKNAEAQKLALTKNMDLELVLEGLIKALGFEDAIVTASTENINVIIKSDEMTEAEVAQVLDIIVSETDKTALDVRIIPVE